MITVSTELLAALTASANRLSDVVEIELSAGWHYFADHTFEWAGNTYLGRLLERSPIRKAMGPDLDDCTVKFSNADGYWRTLFGSLRLVGRRVFVRRIARDVENDSVVIFAGVIRRLVRNDDEACELELVELLGNFQHEVPARTFAIECSLRFKSEECGYVGAATECDKSWSRCTELANTARYFGFRFVPHSGTFSYQTSEPRRWLLMFVRQKRTTKNAQFETVNATPYGSPIPLVFGRAPLAGVVIQYADEGPVLKALVALCAGPIHGVEYIRANDVPVAEWTSYIGEFGGEGAQLVDPRLPNAYPYNLLAYVSLEIPSDAASVDGAPVVTALVKGMQVRRWAVDGSFVDYAWSDNSIWILQGFCQLPLAQGGMGVPEAWFDVASNAVEAAYCDAAMSDAMGDQVIVEPTSGDVEPGEDYQRFQSTAVIGVNEFTDGPYVDPDSVPTTPAPVSVKRFTLNGALARPSKAVDVVAAMLAGTRGFRRYSKAGQIQFIIERAAAPVMTLDASVLCGRTEYPLPERSEQPNQVKVRFYDAPLGAERPIVVNDYEDQEVSHTVRPVEVDGSWIDSAFQAYRIAQCRMLKERDCGGFARLRVDARGCLLQRGDVITVVDVSVGLNRQMMVVGKSLDESFAVEIEAREYSAAVYVESGPRQTAAVPAVLPSTPSPGEEFVQIEYASV